MQGELKPNDLRLYSVKVEQDGSMFVVDCVAEDDTGARDQAAIKHPEAKIVAVIPTEEFDRDQHDYLVEWSTEGKVTETTHIGSLEEAKAVALRETDPGETATIYRVARYFISSYTQR